MQKKVAATLSKRPRANPNDPDDHEQVFSDEEPGHVAFESPESIMYKQLTQCQTDFDKFTQKDQNLARKDTIEVCVDILNRLKAIGSEINSQTEQTRERMYYLTFNVTIIIFKICQKMRVAGFAKEATLFLAFNVLCLDNNLILTTAKFMDWRVLNYVELARAYADLKAFKAALKVTSYGITKILYSKKIEEQDPPVPEGTKETIVEALRVMRTQELKYQLQSGGLNVETWKKRIIEVFNMNKYHRSLAIVECLSLNDVNNCHLVDRNAMHYDLKVACLKSSIDLCMPDIQLIKNALIQIHQKKQRDKEKREKLQTKNENEDVEALMNRFKEQDLEMIKEKDWKFASYNVPVEVHIELIKLCMEAKLWNEFEELLDPALVRLKFRRYEVPFLATIDVQMSSTKISNIPNGFERLPQDINAANLRIELKKLRATAKMTGGGEDEEVPETKGAAKKAEAPKQAPPPKVDPKAAAKPDPKAKPGAKDTKVVTQLEAPPEEKDEIQVSQRELDIINHVYVYMMLQRSKSTQNAIVGVDVVMADETLGPDIPSSHFAVAVPIRQHPGSFQKQKKIPYIVFRRTANSLIDEEDCLSIVTDVQIIMGQDRNLRPPLGYTRIDVDLRQTPPDLERVPNLDYVFVCYKTDKSLALSERDLLIFRRFAELERSFVQKDTDDFKQLPEEAKYLLTTYSLENLNQLARTVKEALLGPLGDYYLEQRRDILEDLALKIYNQYLLPVLMRIDVYVEMRNQKEYYGDFVDLLDKHTINVKNQFLESFDMIHRILTRDSYIENIIMYSKFSVYFANLLEEKGDLRQAVQILRSSVQKIVEYREERMKVTLDSEDSVATSMCITVDNRKIGDLETQIAKITAAWRELIMRKERDLERKRLENPALDDQEGDEEQEEQRLLEIELKEKDLSEKDIDRVKWNEANKIKNTLSGKKYFSEQDMIVHALHVDLIVCLYRCEVKLGKESNAAKGIANKTLTDAGVDLQKHAPGNMTKNLADSLKTKYNLSKTSKTLASNKSALKDLQQTLQEAGKLPPSMPQQLSYEKILEAENNQNPYQQALLYMSLAASKSNSVAQKSLLLESFEFIKKAKSIEDQMSQLAIDNAVQISAARKFHAYFGHSPDKVHPFSLLGKQIYVKKTPVPTQPVMIARTSTSITLKLPFYKPITEYKNWRNITHVSVYGKLQASGVNVSLNNTDYDGTGVMLPPGQIVHVTGLIQNERYVFAAGGYNHEGICVNGIGETCKEILTVHPLSLHQLSGYLAEIAFKLGHYHIAKSAAENVCQAFVTKNEFKYSFLDVRVNPVMSVRLNTQFLNLVSVVEAKQVAESFIILAKVSKILKTDIQKRSETKELKVEAQKIDMKIANYLLIALDIAVLLNRPVLVKRIVCELFNHMIPYFQTQIQSTLLLQITVKCHQSLREVPQEMIDSTTRRILSCLNFQIIRLSFQTNEEPMLKKIMLSELPINTRKWRKFSQYVTIYPKLNEQEQILQNIQKQKIANGEQIIDVDLIKDPPPIEEKQFKFQEFEQEGDALEEFLLTLGDYSDVVRAKTERWTQLLVQFTKQTTDGEKMVDREQKRIKEQLEFWDGLKVNNPIVQLTQICAAVELSPRMLEFACKCIRRAMELPEFKVDEIYELLQNKIKINVNIESEVGEMITSRADLLEKDIVLKQRNRFEQLEEEVKILLEQKSLNGGNKQITNKQLKQIMMMTQQGVQGKHAKQTEGHAQVVIFANEEEEQQRTYDLLWVSEKYFLQGMCLFLQLAHFESQRNVLNLPQTLNCVFDDIIRLDFGKFKSVMTEYQDTIKAKRAAITEQYKDQLIKKTYEPEERVSRLTTFLNVMAQAAKFAINSRSWLQLVSIIQYVWNAFSYDLTTPLELTETNSWKSLTELAECSLYLLEYLQKGGKLRKIMNRDIDQIKNQKPSLGKDKNNRTVQFEDKSEQEAKSPVKVDVSTAEDTANEESKDSKAEEGSSRSAKWFEQIGELDITIQASFISFAIQSLMCVGKWESLVDISNRLNMATENLFASQLLPFIIFAQTTLYEKAAAETTDKKRTLDTRIQTFENWKLTNKKKKSRQAMITGEIPIEEQEFLNDKAILEKEIFRLDVIENVLLSDRDASNKLLENIKRDANNCDEALKACRKLYFQFGVETQSLRSEEQRKGCFDVDVIQNYEIKSKRKSYKVFTNMVIASYKKCVDLLRKRQENFLLIQALHELGNLNYADGNLQEAEIQWNDCVDTIFQRLYVVNQFRSVFKENPNLADSFGSRNVLIGAIVLTKLAKLCYEGKDLHKYMETSIMAAELFAAPARLTLPHPQTSIEYANYNFGEFLDGMLPGETPLFNDKQVIQPSEILHTIYVVIQTMHDLENYHQILPLASLMEFIALKITKSSVLVTKARISKALALVELGYINEAYRIYKKVLMLKNLPKYGDRASEFSDRLDGAHFNLPYDDCYYNDLTPEHDKNQPVIQFIIKPVADDVLVKLKAFATPYVVELLQYLRSSLLIRLGEQQNVENLDKADARKAITKAAEDSLRASLAAQQNAYTIQRLNQEIKHLKIRDTNQQDEEIEKFEKQLAALFISKEVNKVDQANYYCNSEEAMCVADCRTQLMSLMLRTRNQLGRVFRKQGLIINSYYVLKQGLLNFKLVAEGWSNDVETGQEPKEKGTFELPQMFGGSQPDAPVAGAKGGKAQPPPAAPAKGKPGAPVGKGGVVDPSQDEAALKAHQEAEQKKLQELLNVERLKVEAQHKRKHPHILLWLKTKIQIVQILFSQRRFEDCSDTIGVTKLECLAIKDNYFIRQLDEIDFMMQVYNGQTQSALNRGREIRQHAQKYFHSDKNYAEFLGNFSELMYNIDKREEAIEVVKEGRMIAWYKLRDQGIEIDPQNINMATDVLYDVNKKMLTDDVLAAFQAPVIASVVPQGKDAKGKAPPPKAPAKEVKGAPPPKEEFLEDEMMLPLPTVDFSTALKYDVQPAPLLPNNSSIPANIYLSSLAMAIRFDLRYAQYCIVIQDKSELAKKVLIDTQKLIDRCIYCAPQLKFYSVYLCGLASQKIFQEKILQFQSKYAHLKKYQQSLTAHIPYGSFALGQYLIELPGFSSEVRDTLVPLLKHSLDQYNKAIAVGRQECCLFEFDFSLRNALQGASEVHFYLGEYRQRILDYKYADYVAADKERKLQNFKEQKAEKGEETSINEMPKDDGKWEEMKANRESLAIFNHKKASVHYLEAANLVSQKQRMFMDQQNTIGTTNLLDATKAPKEIVTELFESSMVAKVVHSKLPGFEFKDKTTITSAELLAYLKAVLLENRFFTFGIEKERFSCLISKVHRFLKVQLSSYQAQIVPDFKLYEDITVVTQADLTKLLQPTQIRSSWVDMQGKNSYMFYVLGSEDASIRKDELAAVPFTELTESQKAQRLKQQNENALVHFGFVEADPIMLSELHQDVCDLVQKMTASEKLSAAQNERDRRLYQKLFEQQIDRFGSFYKAPVQEADAAKEISCIEAVREVIPMLSVQNVKKFGEILRKETGCAIMDPHFNAILRKFHKIRYPL